MTHSEMCLLVVLFLVAFYAEAAGQTTATEAITTIPTTLVPTTTMAEWPLTTMPITTSTTTATTITSTSASTITTTITTTAEAGIIEHIATTGVTSAVLESTLETTTERITEGTSAVTSTELTTTAETTTPGTAVESTVTEAITTIPTTLVPTTTMAEWPLTTMPITTSTTAATTIKSTSEIPLCYPPCSTDEVCTAIDGYALCQCNYTFYLQADRSQIVPAVDCRGDAMTVSISKCLLERFQYSASNMHLLVNSTECSGPTYEDIVNNERMLFKQVPLQNGWCGTTFSVQGDMVTYTNALYIPPDFTLPTIISSALNMSFSCTYNMIMQTSLQTTLQPLNGTVTPPDVNGTGTAQAIMAAYTNDAFTTPYQVGNELMVGSPVYIGIMTSFADRENFTLRAERCVAAPSNASYDINGVPLITDGCALNQDVNVLYLHNGESLEVRFKMDAFVFQDMPEVYIRCDVRLCKKETPDVCQCSSP
ncbi:uromodulin-like isoform X3 [Ambystoma mexicanum]|uniref:uromodulin-like isoform X3 n=1 Tax=Ambystoma mexicanum TaxID=8296 RepID=UPI0037E8EF28